MRRLEDLFNQFRKAVENTNVIIAVYYVKLMSDIQATPKSVEKTLSAEIVHGVVRAD